MFVWAEAGPSRLSDLISYSVCGEGLGSLGSNAQWLMEELRLPSLYRLVIVL